MFSHASGGLREASCGPSESPSPPRPRVTFGRSNGVRRERTYLAFGVGGIIGLFLVRFARAVAGFEDQELWVVVGDLPAAYFVTEDARTAPEALEVYCELMEDWAERVLSGGEVSDCFPIAAEPTDEHARMLLSRLEYVRQEFVPIAGNAATLKSYDIN